MTFSLIYDLDLQSPASYGHDRLTRKSSRSTVSWFRKNRVETNGRTDGGDCVIPPSLMRLVKRIPLLKSACRRWPALWLYGVRLVINRKARTVKWSLFRVTFCTPTTLQHFSFETRTINCYAWSTSPHPTRQKLPSFVAVVLSWARFNVPPNTYFYKSNDPTNSLKALKEAWS